MGLLERGRIIHVSYEMGRAAIRADLVQFDWSGVFFIMTFFFIVSLVATGILVYLLWTNFWKQT